ncbi:hypothetical protein VCR26J2_170172 [Vibrio coralliirubri]|nr:hypothetical protein VCR26J2_170172 [Vibrio coralliirubri]
MSINVTFARYYDRKTQHIVCHQSHNGIYGVTKTIFKIRGLKVLSRYQISESYLIYMKLIFMSITTNISIQLSIAFKISSLFANINKRN